MAFAGVMTPNEMTTTTTTNIGTFQMLREKQTRILTLIEVDSNKQR